MHVSFYNSVSNFADTILSSELTQRELLIMFAPWLGTLNCLRQILFFYIYSVWLWCPTIEEVLWTLFCPELHIWRQERIFFFCEPFSSGFSLEGLIWKWRRHAQGRKLFLASRVDHVTCNIISLPVFDKTALIFFGSVWNPLFGE